MQLAKNQIICCTVLPLNENRYIFLVKLARSFADRRFRRVARQDSYQRSCSCKKTFGTAT